MIPISVFIRKVPPGPERIFLIVRGNLSTHDPLAKAQRQNIAGCALQRRLHDQHAGDVRNPGGNLAYDVIPSAAGSQAGFNTWQCLYSRLRGNDNKKQPLLGQ